MGDHATCQHEQFSVSVTVNRIEDPGQPLRFIADVKIQCMDCGEHFRFLGVPAGLDFERPTVSVDGLELHAPLEPEIVKVFHEPLVYRMPPSDDRREERDLFTLLGVPWAEPEERSL